MEKNKAEKSDGGTIFDRVIQLAFSQVSSGLVHQIYVCVCVCVCVYNFFSLFLETKYGIMKGVGI